MPKKHASQFTKGRAISKFECGESFRKIRKKLKVGHNTIKLLVDKWKTVHVVCRKTGSGRP